jgi:hypothetical protein
VVEKEQDNYLLIVEVVLKVLLHDCLSITLFLNKNFPLISSKKNIEALNREQKIVKKGG